MLVLSLSQRQGRDSEMVITLPDGRRVHVAVLDHDRYKVRLGIMADRDIRIHRGSVQRAIDKQEDRQEDNQGDKQ